MKTEYTPKPWKLDKATEFGDINKSSLALVANGWDNFACIVTKFSNSDTNKEGEANAKLIAAAPDILEALMAIVAAQDDHEKSLAKLNSAITNSKMVIKKATE